MVVVGLLDLESFHVKLDTSISKSILTSSEENSLPFTIFFHKDSHERAVVKCLHCFLSDMETRRERDKVKQTTGR